jgi:hypothetical protein
MQSNMTQQEAVSFIARNHQCTYDQAMHILLHYPGPVTEDCLTDHLLWIRAMAGVAEVP